MSQQRLRVPEPEGLHQKRTSSEDNLYLAVLRASEGKKGSGTGRPVSAAGSPACRERRPDWNWVPGMWKERLHLPYV